MRDDGNVRFGSYFVEKLDVCEAECALIAY